MSSATQSEEPCESVPRAGTFAEIYDEVLDLVDGHLQRPVTATIDTYEDGTFRIQIYHHVPPDTREALYYHSAEGTVFYGVEDGDELKEMDPVTSIEPPAGSRHGDVDKSRGRAGPR